jgi:hypothetical protein
MYPAKLQGREIKNMHRPFNRVTRARRPPFVSRSRRASTGAAVVAVLLTGVVACSSGTSSSTASAASATTPNGTAASAPDMAKEKAYLAQ